jgi:putative transposase
VGIWSLSRRGPTANNASADPEHPTRALHRGLAHVQGHPELVDGHLTETGPTIA